MSESRLGVVVRSVRSDEAEWLETVFNRSWPWPRPSGFVRQCIETRPHLVAEGGDGTYLGHCRINPSSVHAAFRDRAIPEIEDLNVMPAFRRRGAATALMDRAETMIGQTSKVAGIGVGLYRDYGPAQRLYTRRGYVLDGTGLWWKHRSVGGGESVVADDDLVLYLTKQLS